MPVPVAAAAPRLSRVDDMIFFIYKEYRVICEKGLCIVLRGLVAARNSMDEDSRRSNHLHIKASASGDRATLGLRASAKWHFSQKLWGECQR